MPGTASASSASGVGDNAVKRAPLRQGRRHDGSDLSAFLAPIGYPNAPRSMGKSLMHDTDRAPLVRRAFEEYATGRFTKGQLLEQVRT